MCGFLYTNIPLSREKFLKSLSLAAYRGPDYPLCYSEYENHKFGHNRLVIIDNNPRSNQPFRSEDERYIMVYNGEIYNYKELAKDYNIFLKTNCDTELLLKLYIKIGPAFLNHLNGMFSFVIYDSIEDKFFAARDRLGVKPLYYHKSQKGIILSSDISSIVELLGVGTLDDFSIRQYKKLRSTFNGRTFFKEVRSLEAGHYFDGNSIKKYWELNLVEKASPSECELENMILSAINDRMISDVSIGSYLSGGLDSSFVSSVISRGIKEDFHTWSIGFSDNNEFEWSDKVSNFINSNHHKIFINEEEFIELLRFMIAKKREPLSVPNEVLIYKMSKEAKAYNTVLISGEGADEIFFGYDRIFNWANRNKFDLHEFDRLYSYGSVNDMEVLEDALHPFLSKYERSIDIVSSFFQIGHLGGLLKRLDSSSMLAGIEARSPFLDYRLIEAMAGVSFDQRTSYSNPKMLLKKIAAKYLPKETIQRPKVGFPVDVNKIIKGSNSSGYDKWLDLNLEIFQQSF